MRTNNNTSQTLESGTIWSQRWRTRFISLAA